MRFRGCAGIFAAGLLLFGLELAGFQETNDLLASRSVSQKLSRAVYLDVLHWCIDISYAESLDRSVQDCAKYRAKLLAPSWEGIRGRGVGAFIRSLLSNDQLQEDFLFEILAEAEDSVTVRTNRPYAVHFKDQLSLLGVGIEKYELGRTVFMEEIAKSLGFAYTERNEGGWRIITVTPKENVPTG